MATYGSSDKKASEPNESKQKLSNNKKKSGSWFSRYPNLTKAAILVFLFALVGSCEKLLFGPDDVTPDAVKKKATAKCPAIIQKM